MESNILKRTSVFVVFDCFSKGGHKYLNCVCATREAAASVARWLTYKSVVDGDEYYEAIIEERPFYSEFN